MNTARTPLSPTALDPADLTDLTELIEVLTLVQAFLNYGDGEVVDELASYQVPPPQDPPTWTRWVAELLGQHAAALSALLTSPTPGSIGEPR